MNRHVADSARARALARAGSITTRASAIDRAAGMREHRVQVHLLQPGQQRRPCARRRPAPRRARRGRPAARCDSRRAAGTRAVRCISSRASMALSGGSATRGVAHRLDRDAARAERDHRAEHRIGGDADQHFARMREAQHRLHHHALDARLGPQRAHVPQHVVERRGHHLRVLQVQAHAADVGLVRDVGRVQLEHHREADLARRRDRRLCDLWRTTDAGHRQAETRRAAPSPRAR